MAEVGKSLKRRDYPGNWDISARNEALVGFCYPSVFLFAVIALRGGAGCLWGGGDGFDAGSVVEGGFGG